VESLQATHDAVVLAHGAGKALRLPVEGGELSGVVDATTFLHAALATLTDGEPFALFARGEDDPNSEERTVLVLGAGNTAMDVARLARRLGAKAISVDWMDQRYAPVRPDELDEAREEGVDIRFCRTLTRVEGSNGRVERAIICTTSQRSATELPKIQSGVEISEKVDLVVMAMGYRIDSIFGGLAPSRPIERKVPVVADRRIQASGLLAAGSPVFARSRPVGELTMGREVGRLSAALGSSDGIFVAGDALVGPSSVVEAMAQGRRCAEAILRRCAHGVSAAGEVKVPSVLIAYDSAGGRTEALAREIAEALEHLSVRATARRLCDVGLNEIVDVDLLVIGTWVEGFLFYGVGPAKSTSAALRALPELRGVQVATFCSYGFNPASTLAQLRSQLEERGASVVAAQAFDSRVPQATSVVEFATQLHALITPEPTVEDVMTLAKRRSESVAPAQAAQELSVFARGYEMLLAQGSARFLAQLAQTPQDEGVRRALETIEGALSELHTP
jgi:flavodoxin